jgi:hypothetical protein
MGKGGLALVAGWLVAASIGRAGVLVVYDGGTMTATNAPSAVAGHVTASAFTANEGRSLIYPSGTEPTPTYSMAASGWNESNRWYEFTVTAAPGYAMDLDSLEFDERAVNPVPTSWWVRCSLDGFTSVLGAGPTTPAFGPSPMHVVALDVSGVTGSVTFRIGATKSDNSGAKWRIDNVQLSGDVHGDSFRAVSIQKNSPLSITWESIPAHSYRVEFATSAINSVWTTLYTNVTATSTVMSVNDVSISSDRVRIYRVIRQD